MIKLLKQKLIQFIGFDKFENRNSLDKNMITIIQLQTENREQKEIIRKQNALLQELSEENMELGRDRRRYADTVITQQRLIDVYKSMSF